MKRRLAATFALLSAAQAAPLTGASPLPEAPPKVLPANEVPENFEVPRVLPVHPEPTPSQPASNSFREEATPTLRVPVGPDPAPLSEAAPKQVDANPLALADALFARKQYDLAAPEYLRFIEQFPKSPDIGAAYFRLAESYQKLGNHNSARLYYEKNAALSQSTPMTGVANYKLAEYEFQAGEYAPAQKHYSRAEQLLNEPGIKVSAQYFSARCLQLLGKKADARAAFRPLADSADNHPFREASRFQYGLLSQEAGASSEALPYFEKLAADAKTPTIRGESATRQALILLELNQSEKALGALQKALALPETEPWRTPLQLGQMQALAALGQHEKAVAVFEQVSPGLSAEQLPDTLLLAASSRRALKQFDKALALYNQLIETAPSSNAAAAARYDRLTAMYNLDKPELPQEIDAFLKTNPKTADQNNALLMRAEVLRSRKDYTAAAEAYTKALASKELKKERRLDALLRLSECAVRSENAARTVSATTEFLEAAPNHSLSATLLFWRAEAQRRSKNNAAAEKDYRAIDERHPKAAERESALRQLALLRGEQNDPAGMSAAFARLLKDYPESSTRAEAFHWIGWAAFEARDYAKAVPALEQARQLDAEHYFESDSLRLIYCAYYLNDPESCWTRVQQYHERGKNRAPLDVLRWCAQQFLDAKAPAKAVPPLELICSAEDATEADWLSLAQSKLSTSDYNGAEKAAASYLKLVTHAASKARGMLIQGKAQLARGELDNADKTVKLVLPLQAEGTLNAEARILSGDILAERKSWEEAAKTYASVAIIIDDDSLTPVALEKAYKAYRSANKPKEAADALNRLQSRFPEYARALNLR